MKSSLPAFAALATAAFLVAPFVTPPFDGFAPEAFPVAQVNPPVQPAGYAFGIWGVIYLWLAVSAAAGLFWRRAQKDWHRVQLPMILSLGPGAAWLWLAGVAPVAATVLIFWMLGFALLAMWNLPAQDRWLLQAPVALYAGWLTAAAHVSLGVTLGGHGLLPADQAALVVLVSATLLSILILVWRPRVVEYGLAVLWALMGIMVANLDGNTLVFGATLIAFLLVGAVLSRGLLHGHRKAAGK